MFKINLELRMKLCRFFFSNAFQQKYFSLLKKLYDVEKKTILKTRLLGFNLKRIFTTFRISKNILKNLKNRHDWKEKQ